MVEQMRAAIQTASGSGQKIAMFHFQVLKNADALRGVHAVGFCAELGVPASYATEFTKMLALAQLLKEQGARLEVS